MENKEFKPFIIAVYGTLKKGYGNNRLLTTSEQIVGNFKTSEKFDLYSFGGFPAITENGNNNIVVELYKIVDPLVADRLDRLEGYPNFYNKKKISIIDFDSNLPIYIYYIEDIKEYNVIKLEGINEWSK